MEGVCILVAHHPALMMDYFPMSPQWRESPTSPYEFRIAYYCQSLAIDQNVLMDIYVIAAMCLLLVDTTIGNAVVGAQREMKTLGKNRSKKIIVVIEMNLHQECRAALCSNTDTFE